MVKTYSASQALSRVRKDQARASVPYRIKINIHDAQYRCKNPYSEEVVGTESMMPKNE